MIEPEGGDRDHVTGQQDRPVARDYGASWRVMPPEYRDANPVVPRHLLEAAHLFLESIASADAQGEQGAWMIQQAREGLRRSGGRDFDDA